MLTLKAGFYIDEINYQIQKLVGKEVLVNFLKNNIHFKASGLPLIIKPEKPSSLIKVAWNIITRGEPTRASLELSQGILSYHLKDHFIEIDTHEKNSETNVKIKTDFFNGIDKSELTELLENFSFWSEEDIVRFGTRLFSLYKVLHDLITSAQIQNCILLYLMDNEGEKNYSFSFHGINHYLGAKIIQDLNNLFNALNSLVENEKELPYLKYDAANKKETIEIGINQDCDGIVVNQFFEPIQNCFSHIFTGEYVNYRQLSKNKRHESQKEEFEYKTQKQQKALEYFLQNIFRKNKFRAGQEAIINRAIQTKDVIGLLPTGGGKSLTYQICGLLQPGVTVVVDPINSLMKDQFDKLISNGITKSAFINSSISKEEKEYHLNFLAEGKYQFIFISPERFQIQEFRDALLSCKTQNVYYSYAVIDEAHCVSEWGHDFRHSYLKLSDNIRRFCLPMNGRLPLFGLTATASFDVLADVQRELDMQDDSIVTLPAKAIDREELHFEIIPVESQVSIDEKFYEREKRLGRNKYPQIKNLLLEMPDRISSFEKKYGFLNPSLNFYEKTENGYENAGVIFCPSKSDKLPFGVLHLKNGRDGFSGLNQLNFLNISTFFGSQDDDTVQDDFINEQAKDSANQQEAFIQNESNLMIATKAFGMGIDKPNIRFTIHYAFPNSVESFYQEAGRAGRDRNPSLCSIFYCPDDIQTNYDFYAASFRGVRREKQIIDELLDEVHYEDDFFINVLLRKVKEKFPEVYSLSLFAGKYIYLNGKNEFIERDGRWFLKEPEKAIKIGRLTLNSYLADSSYDIKNFDINRSKKITNYLKEILQSLCPEKNYEEWIVQKASNGINTILKSNSQKNHQLNIGFNNDVISIMTDKIKAEGIDDFKEVYIRAAYKFSKNEEEFIESLYFNYAKDHSFFNQLILNEETNKFLRESYYRVRNTSDTLRAIYRMSVLGIIDDYVVDYVGGFIKVFFKGKKESEYKENFEKYLRRYLGVDSTIQRLKNVESIDESSILKRVLYVLIQFIEEEIATKRRRSIEYMRDLCSVFIKEGETEFRERMVTYFTSKYARTDFLPKATQNGTIENAAVVKEYIEYIFKPPDGLGGQIDNAKHLRGACDNLRINLRENASIDLLTSFSFFALDAKPNESEGELIESEMFKQAEELFRKGFKRLLQFERWKVCKELLQFFILKAKDINPGVEPLIIPLTNEILLSRTTYKLNNLLTKISEHEGLN